MSDSRVAVPERTKARITEWLRVQMELQALIDSTVVTLRETLNVPEGWVLRDLDAGFVAPPDAPKASRADPEGNAPTAVG